MRSVVMVAVLAACRFNFDSLAPDALEPDAPPDASLCASEGADWADWTMPNDTGSGRPHAQQYASSGTVTRDLVSGLYWQQAAAPGTYSWADAKQYCATLSLDGACWRLPHRVELASIVNYAMADPAVAQGAFPSTPIDQFWSATIAAGSPTEAWTLNFSAGHADYVPQTEQHAVRCVQVTPPPAANRYQLDVDTVLDLQTGLEWQRTLDPASYDFNQAIAYCMGLALAGGGWREPSIQEMQTLVDSSRTGTLIDTTVFPGTPGALFWTSSPQVKNVTMGWSLDFAFGYAYRPQTAGLRVRCVRP